MKYYVYNINTGWSSGALNNNSLTAGYINADNEVALDLWVEKTVTFDNNSNDNAFKFHAFLTDFNIKIYTTLPSYVSHSAPPVIDDNGRNLEDYIAKLPQVESAIYYINIRSNQALAAVNNLLSLSLSVKENKYHITYKWMDSSGIQQEHS